MRTLLKSLVIGICGLLLCVRATANATWEPVSIPEASLRNLTERIRAVIPKGWAVSYEAEYNYLKIALEKPVKVETAVMNAPAGGSEPFLEKLGFAFRVIPKVPVETFQRLAAENAQTRAKMAVIYRELLADHIQGKGDSFSPETPWQRTKVDEYEKLRASLHPLPDFYFKEEVSLHWMENGPERYSPPPRRAIDDTVQAEFERVRAEVMKLLTAYPPGN